MGMDPTTELTATDRDITFRSASLFGSVTHVVPLTSVASASSAVRKPVHYLALAVLCLLGGFYLSFQGSWSALLVGIVLCAVFVVAYALGRRFAISISTSGTTSFGLQFKQSVIEGRRLDPNLAEEAARVIRDLCTSAGSGAPSGATSSAMTETGNLRVEDHSQTQPMIRPDPQAQHEEPPETAPAEGGHAETISEPEAPPPEPAADKLPRKGCPHCKQPLTLKPELAGKKVRCPKCKETFTV
jgi:hypothetical protein